VADGPPFKRKGLETQLKARRFLHPALQKAGLDRHGGDAPINGIAVIKVPALPFLEPVFEKYGTNADVVANRFPDRFARVQAAGDFGRAD
jgi:hypothetical protein